MDIRTVRAGASFIMGGAIAGVVISFTQYSLAGVWVLVAVVAGIMIWGMRKS